MSADDPDDPGRPPTDEEVAASQRLRDRLAEDPVASALKAAWDPQAIDPAEHARIVDETEAAEELALAALIDEDDLVLALKAAWNPTPLDSAEHARMVDRATARMTLAQRPRSVTRIRIALVTATSIAIAAGFILWLQNAPPGPGREVALAHTRSTQPLFEAPFKEGETSARIDRIAMARASDYRDNYFARRGVR